MDESRLILVIEDPTPVLLPTIIATPQTSAPEPKADTGLFFNYDDKGRFIEKSIRKRFAASGGRNRSPRQRWPKLSRGQTDGMNISVRDVV
ncbi:MAG: hypothetical protein ACRERV_07800 [Methylococcales bacterium]